MKPTFKKILMSELKQAGLGSIMAKIKSVRCDYNSAKITTLDLFKTERVYLESIVSKYKKGSFDGMTDCYDYTNLRSDLPIQFNYVFINNEFSESVKNSAVTCLREQWDITDDNSAQARMGCWYDQAVWRTLQDLEVA